MLQEFLEEEYRERRLVYGVQKSREALVTCIVQSYTGNHLHFVDGSDGGWKCSARNSRNKKAPRKALVCSFFGGHAGIRTLDPGFARMHP